MVSLVRAPRAISSAIANPEALTAWLEQAAAVMALIVLQQLVHVLSVRIWGTLSDRFSNKAVLSASLPLAIAAVAAWSFTTLPERYALSIPLLIVIQIGIGSSATTALAENDLLGV